MITLFKEQIQQTQILHHKKEWDHKKFLQLMTEWWI